MNTLQTRLELQGAVQQWVDSFMAQHNISPAMMDDALSKALLNIKELVIQEYLIAAQMASSNILNCGSDGIFQSTRRCRGGTRWAG